MSVRAPFRRPCQSLRRRAAARCELCRSCAPWRCGRHRRILRVDEAQRELRAVPRARHRSPRPRREPSIRAAFADHRRCAASGRLARRRRRCCLSRWSPLSARAMPPAAGLKFAQRVGARFGCGRFRRRFGPGTRHRRRCAPREPCPAGTMAVLAGGHDSIYPPDHVELLAAFPAERRGRFRKCRSA